MLGIILLIAAVLIAVAYLSQQNGLFHSTSTNCIISYDVEPGQLTNALLATTVEKIVGNDNLKSKLEWFEKNVDLFSFTTHDGVVMQGYHLKGKRDGTSTEPPIIVHATGYTEAVVKYVEYFYFLNQQLGYSVYTYDHRGW